MFYLYLLPFHSFAFSQRAHNLNHLYHLFRLTICNALTERQEKAAEEEEKQRLEDMDEEEYDALPAEERERIDRKRLEIKKDKLKR